MSDVAGECKANAPAPREISTSADDAAIQSAKTAWVWPTVLAEWSCGQFRG